MIPDDVAAETTGRPEGDLAERLQRLADTRTADRRPWPGVDRAVRRSHRRRLARLSAATALSVALAGAAYAGVVERSSHARSESPAGRVRLAGLAQLRAAGYADPTGGSLAGDDGYLTQVRRRVQDLTRHMPATGGRADLDGPEQVLISWASEVSGSRYVVAVYPAEDQSPEQATQPTFGEVVLSGPIGAAAADLQVVSATSWADVDPTKITSFSKVFVPTADPGQGPASLVLVTGPTVTGVRVATARHFSSNGKVATDWRPLRREGRATWVGELSPAELYLADVQIDGADDSHGENGEPVFPGIAQMASLAPPGTDQTALACASSAQRQLGASVNERPVLGLTAVTSPKNTLAVTVFRAPDGPYLVTFCVVRARPRPEEPRGATGRFDFPLGGGGPSTGALVPHGPGNGDTNSLMIAVETDPLQEDAFYLVLAPAGAQTVSVGDKIAPVHNRLAVLPRITADPYAPAATVWARNADGIAIGSVKTVRGR
jgi:hypothetical protein